MKTPFCNCLATENGVGSTEKGDCSNCYKSWGQWSSWSGCTKTCDDPGKYRNRTCSVGKFYYNTF